jgi:hypothetical protein
MGFRCQVSGVSPLHAKEKVQLEGIVGMPDTSDLVPSALYQKSHMKDHEKEVYSHEISSWIKPAAFQASGCADT